MEIGHILELVFTFIVGGGLTALFTMRQTKEGKKIENAQKLCDEYIQLLEKYKEQYALSQEENESLRKKIQELEKYYDEKVERYEEEIADLKRTVKALDAELGLIKRQAAKKSTKKATAKK